MSRHCSSRSPKTAFLVAKPLFSSEAESVDIELTLSVSLVVWRMNLPQQVRLMHFGMFYCCLQKKRKKKWRRASVAVTTSISHPPGAIESSRSDWGAEAEGYSDLGRYLGSFSPPPTSSDANQQKRWVFVQAAVNANRITPKIVTPVKKKKKKKKN
jgi:hypothetical protein